MAKKSTIQFVSINSTLERYKFSSQKS